MPSFIPKNNPPKAINPNAVERQARQAQRKRELRMRHNERMAAGQARNNVNGNKRVTTRLSQRSDKTAFEYGEEFFAKHAVGSDNQRILRYPNFNAFEQDFATGEAYQQSLVDRLRGTAQKQQHPRTYSREAHALVKELKQTHATQLADVSDPAQQADLKSQQQVELLKFQAMARQYKDALFHLYSQSEEASLQAAKARFAHAASRSAGLSESLDEITSDMRSNDDLQSGSSASRDGATDLGLDWDKVKEKMNYGGITYSSSKKSIPIKVLPNGGMSFNIHGASTEQLYTLAEDMLDIMQIQGKTDLDGLNLDGRRAPLFNDILRMKAAERGIDLNKACNEAKIGNTEPSRKMSLGAAMGQDKAWEVKKHKQFDKNRHLSDATATRTAQSILGAQKKEYVGEAYKNRHARALEKLKVAAPEIPKDEPSSGPTGP